MNLPDDHLYSVLYTSDALIEFDGAQLDELLTQSREANRRAAITGVLLYRADRFVQVLEGPKDAVDATLDRITRDTRHANVRVLIDEPLAARQFADWSMGFERLSPATDAAPEGFRDTFVDLDGSDDPSVTLRAARELSMWFRARASRPEA